jgi:hypothetical protein
MWKCNYHENKHLKPCFTLKKIITSLIKKHLYLCFLDQAGINKAMAAATVVDVTDSS